MANPRYLSKANPYRWINFGTVCENDDNADTADNNDAVTDLKLRLLAKKLNEHRLTCMPAVFMVLG